MPRKRKAIPNESANAEDSLLRASDTSEDYPARAMVPTTERGSVEVSTALAVPQSGNERTLLRDSFEDEAARLLGEVRSVLGEVLTDGNNKERLGAAKLLLQVNGLLEKRQSLDSESISNLVSALLRRSPITIRDLPPES